MRQVRQVRQTQIDSGEADSGGDFNNIYFITLLDKPERTMTESQSTSQGGGMEVMIERAQRAIETVFDIRLSSLVKSSC